MKTKQMGWFCTYTPVELIAAAGLSPYGIRRDSGYAHEDVCLGDSICSYVRSCVGGALSGAYDFLDGVVIAHSCECMRRLYDAWRFKQEDMAPARVFFLDVPRIFNDRSVTFFAAQLRRLRIDLEAVYGPISDARLRETIRKYNYVRELFARIMEMRKAPHTPVSGMEVARLIHGSMTVPLEDFIPKLEACMSEMIHAREMAGPRIMICGGPGNGNLVSTIENAGGIVVCENTCNGFRSIDGPVDPDDDPMIALSRRYLGKNPCPRMLGAQADAGLGQLRSLAESYRVDGIIYYSVKFCANMQASAAVIKNEIDTGVPVKLMEGDINEEIDEREVRSFIKKLSLKRPA